jgi:hypothetical protein
VESGHNCYIVKIKPSAAATGYTVGFQQKMQRSTAQQYDYFGLDKFDLLVQIPDTGGGFIFARHPVPRRAAFYNIGDINFLAPQVHSVDHFIQQLPRGSHKGASGGIFICAGPFANKHQPGIGRTFAENNVLTGIAQSAVPAIQCHITQTIPVAGYFARLRYPECWCFFHGRSHRHTYRRRYGLPCGPSWFGGANRNWRRRHFLPRRRSFFHGAADAAGKFLPLFRRNPDAAFGTVGGDSGSQIIKKIHINHPFSDNITLFWYGAS